MGRQRIFQTAFSLALFFSMGCDEGGSGPQAGAGSGQGSGAAGSGAEGSGAEGSASPACWFEEGSGLCPDEPRGSVAADCASGRIARPSDLPGTSGVCLPALRDWDCPEGWSAVPTMGSGAPADIDDFDRCEPPAVANDCGPEEVASPLHPACAPFGASCPSLADRWHDEATIRSEAPGLAGPIFYAAPDGLAAAPCTRAEPCLLDDALVARAEGGIIAAAVGRYETALLLDRAVALVGACASATLLHAPTTSETTAIVEIRSEAPVTVAQIRLEGERMGMVIGAPLSGITEALHSLHALRLHTLQGRGLFVTEGTRAELRDLFATDMQATPSDRKRGRALQVNAGSQLTITAAVIRRAMQIAVVMADAGTQLTIEDLLVEDTQPSATGSGVAMGVAAEVGASLTLRDALVRRVNDSALFFSRGATFDGARILVDRVAISSSQPPTGWGLSVELGAIATLDTVLMRDCTERGIRVAGAGSQLDAHQLAVERVAPRPGDGTMGWGLSIEAGAAVKLDKAQILHAHEFGVSVDGDGSSVTASELLVADTQASPVTRNYGRGVSVQFGGSATLAQSLLLRNREYGIVAAEEATLDLDTTTIESTRASLSNGLLGAGLAVLFGSHLTFRDLAIRSNLEHGIVADAAETTVTGDRLLVVGTGAPEANGLGGRGLAIQGGATADLSDLWVTDNRDMGLFVAGAGTRLDLARAVIARTLPRTSDSQFGRGINVQEGAQLTVTDALIWRNHDLGLFADGAGTRFTGSRLRIQETAPRAADSAYGVGMTAQQGAALSLSETLFRSNHAHGLLIQSEGTVADLRSITIEGTLPSARDGRFGSGLVLYRGSQTTATNLTLQDNALCGLQAVSDLTSFDIDGALIARNQVGANLQVAGLVGDRLSAALRNERFVDNAQDLLFLDLPVPEGGDPGASP